MLDHLITQRLVTLHGLFVFAGLAIYVIGSRTRRQRRHPSAAIAWVVLLALLPYVALPLYLLFGNRKVARRSAPLPAASLSGGPVPASCRTPFHQLAGAMGLPAVASYRALNIHQDGQQALSALRTVLQAARRSLDVCTFLIGRDALGRELVDTLVDRAREGVRVRLLVDGVGVYLGGRIDMRRLRAAGVEVVLFVSPFGSVLPGRTNLRNHRKLVIADGCHAWTGGRNLAAEYFVGDPARLHRGDPWIDLSLDLCGPLAFQTQQRFDLDWAFATGTPLVASPPTGAQSDAGGAGDPRGTGSTVANAATVALAGTDQTANPSGLLIASGPDQYDDTLHALLVSSCFGATTRILAVTPYFVPDPVLLMALTLAARRNVAVDLVLPQRSNHRLADLARHAALRELAAAGGRIWLLPDMVHAKAVLVDDALALVGSANLDERSLFLNYELMLAFFDRADVARFAAWIEGHRASAVAYRGQRPGLLRELLEGLVRWLAFQL